MSCSRTDDGRSGAANVNWKIVAKVIAVPVVLISLSACYRTETVDGDVSVCSIDGQQRVKISYIVEGRGNAHYPGISKYRYSQSDEILTPASVGAVAGDRLTLNRTDSRMPTGPLRGEIRFLSEGFLELALDIPQYRAHEIAGWTSYPLNGRYPISNVGC
jgi:hypothetical protein